MNRRASWKVIDPTIRARVFYQRYSWPAPGGCWVWRCSVLCLNPGLMVIYATSHEHAIRMASQHVLRWHRDLPEILARQLTT